MKEVKPKEKRISLLYTKWEFPKIRGTFFLGPYNKDPTIWGTILGSPMFGNSQISFWRTWSHTFSGDHEGRVFVTVPAPIMNLSVTLIESLADRFKETLYIPYSFSGP